MVNHLADDPFYVTGQGAAVGVAKYKAVGTGHCRLLKDPYGKLRVLSVAVEEVFGVEKYGAVVFLEEADRVGDHGHAFVEGGPQRPGHVVLGGLPDNAHHPGICRQQVLEGQVVVDLPLHAAGRAEGHQPGVDQLQFGLGPVEELIVLRVGARPTAFDVVHAKSVQLLGDA